MSLVDLSHSIRTGMPVFPGDPEVVLEPAATLEADGFAVTHVAMGSHSGTHVDAPSHSIDGGRTMSEVALDQLVGEAHVLRALGLAPGEEIGIDLVAGQLDALPAQARIVLVATGWDARWGEDAYLDHPHLAPELAAALRDRGVDVVGVDCLSPDPSRQDEATFGLPVHEILLGADRLIIENLRGLAALPDELASLEFAALPVALDGADGAPVRAIARLREPGARGCSAEAEPRVRGFARGPGYVA